MEVFFSWTKWDWPWDNHTPNHANYQRSDRCASDMLDRVRRLQQGKLSQRGEFQPSYKPRAKRQELSGGDRGVHAASRRPGLADVYRRPRQPWISPPDTLSDTVTQMAGANVAAGSALLRLSLVVALGEARGSRSNQCRLIRRHFIPYIFLNVLFILGFYCGLYHSCCYNTFLLSLSFSLLISKEICSESFLIPFNCWYLNFIHF